MTKSAEPSTPSGSSETQQRRRQITSYKNTTTSPATDTSNPLRGLRCIRRPDASGNLGALLALDHADVILPLQVQPELRTVAKITAEPHRGIGRDGAAAVKNVRDAAGRNADIERQPVCAELTSR